MKEKTMSLKETEDGLIKMKRGSITDVRRILARNKKSRQSKIPKGVKELTMRIPITTADLRIIFELAANRGILPANYISRIVHEYVNNQLANKRKQFKKNTENQALRNLLRKSRAKLKK